MVDMETMGNGPDAPIVSIGAVFFDPSTGNTGAEFYQVVSLESSMSFGMKPDASTIQWWLKQSSEARSAILVDEAMGLLETLELWLTLLLKTLLTVVTQFSYGVMDVRLITSFFAAHTR